MWLTIKCYFNYFQYNDNKYLIDLITFYTVLTFHQFQKAGSCSAEVKPDHSQMLTTIFHIIPNAYYNFSHYTVLCNISYKAENEIFQNLKKGYTVLVRMRCLKLHVYYFETMESIFKRFTIFHIILYYVTFLTKQKRKYFRI